MTPASDRPAPGRPAPEQAGPGTGCRIELVATDGAARAGRLRTPRHLVPTPCFMPVGTKGVVRGVTGEDLTAAGARIVLANTYHLMLRPGADVVRGLGGLHRFEAWDGALLTDSGGYQVFSLSPKVDDEGVTFRSTYDGSTHRLTPEGAVDVQERLGADIQMALDVCPPLPSPAAELRRAVERTARWAGRARQAFLAGAERRAGWDLAQSQFGIVQGGTDLALRRESTERTVAVGFDGYAVGGLSVGEARDDLLVGLAAAVEDLPADQPRYLMGVGDPSTMVEAVGLGIDLFDCVLPTRHARHGTILTDAGRVNLRARRHAVDPGPLDPACPCPTCQRYSRGYLRHLLQVGELTGWRLLTIHNLWWILGFTAALREAVLEGRYEAFRRRTRQVWG